MKITVLLKKDHETITSLFAASKKTAGRGQNGRKEFFEEIRREIMIHSQMEAEIFYPALSGTSSTHAEELVASATDEHTTIEKLLRELANFNGNDRQFDAKM